MSKGQYTRKQASLQAFLEVTGEQLPSEGTLEQIKEYSRSLPEAQSARCHELYRQLMSIGRPNYLERYEVRYNRGRSK